MKNKITLRGIRDGAMMTALTVIFMLLTIYVPVFSYVGMFLTGIPLAALYIRDGLTTAICATVCSVLIMFAVTGEIFTVLVFAFMYAVPGLVAGICIKKRYNFFYSIIYTAAAFLAGLIFELFLVNLFLGGVENMLNELFKGVQLVLEESMRIIAENNSALDVKAAAKTLIDTFSYVAKMYFPSILIVSSLLFAYIMYSIASVILKKLKLCSVVTIPFYMLRAPKSMSTAAILLYIAGIFMNPESMVSAAFYNIIFVLYAFLAFCGFSFIDFKFKNVVKKGFLRALIYIVLFIFGGMIATLVIRICIILGILDSSLNFRRISAIDEDNNI